MSNNKREMRLGCLQRRRHSRCSSTADTQAATDSSVRFACSGVRLSEVRSEGLKHPLTPCSTRRKRLYQLMPERGNGWEEGQQRASPLTPHRGQEGKQFADRKQLMPGVWVSVWYSFGCAGKSFVSPDTHLTAWLLPN